MKKPRFFISVVVFFLLTSLRAQVPHFYTASDTLSDIARFERLSYEQQISKTITLLTPWVGLTYSDLDTSAKQLSINAWLELPRVLVSAMVRDFRSDTLLTPVSEPLEKGNNQAIQFGKMTLKWHSVMKAFISEGPLPLLAIGKKTINKEVRGYVLMEKKRSGNVLIVYLENGSGGWYTFNYSNGIMLIYASDEKLQTKIAKHHVERGKSAGSRYRTTLGSPNERNLLFKKLKRAGVLHETNLSSANKKIALSSTSADTLHIDSIAEAITKLSAPALYTSSTFKVFDCENPDGQGTVTVSTGQNLLKLTVSLCGSDHGGSGFEALFYNDTLIFLSEESGSWSFDPEHSSDSLVSTLDETITVADYIENGIVIKNIHSYIILYNYTGEQKSIDNTTYYFDKEGEMVAEREKQLRNWIAFLYSTKSYADFFESADK